MWDGTCCTHFKDLAVHVPEETEGGCHTIVNTRSEGSPPYSAGQVLLLSVLVLFIQAGWSQEPHQNKLAKGTFHCGRDMEFPKVRTAGLSDCISIKQLAFFLVPHLLLSSLASLQGEGSCGSSGSGPALELRASLPGACLQGEPLYLSRRNTRALGQLCCFSPLLPDAGWPQGLPEN